MKMERKKFRIGELADHLCLEPFIIRCWEKEFKINANRSLGGQRFYTEREIKKFVLIKDLLYNKGFTIINAKKHLQEFAQKSALLPSFQPSKITSLEDYSNTQHMNKIPEPLIKQIIDLQKKLLHLRRLL